MPVSRWAFELKQEGLTKKKLNMKLDLIAIGKFMATAELQSVELVEKNNNNNNNLRNYWEREFIFLRGKCN